MCIRDSGRTTRRFVDSIQLFTYSVTTNFEYQHGMTIQGDYIYLMSTLTRPIGGGLHPQIQVIRKSDLIVQTNNLAGFISRTGSRGGALASDATRLYYGYQGSIYAHELVDPSGSTRENSITLFRDVT